MFSLEVETDGEARDMLICDLWQEGSTGVVETDLPDGRCRLRAFFDDDADAAALASRFQASVERHAPRDWVALSRSDWAPLEVGERFFLVPEWLEDPAPPGRLRIEINPGMACGTGFHEATQLCLEAMEQYLDRGMTVADVGAGSGILAIAAALLGAARVAACDLDEAAVEIAASNVRRTGVCVLPLAGSADAIRSGCADLIVANISAAASIELAPGLLRCLAAGGRCVVSGFERGEADAVQTALERAGAEIERRMEKGEWRALVFHRR
ncbi:MAG TPA: 50S ribosomal protein L11 methyltransferase [Bryobacteraceae bacterium]|jgi:ribosomal protein L11 methyltransferase|nr:50S ribosomal protein L11 methyltransferase [Bryobacteraceae bacterium]